MSNPSELVHGRDMALPRSCCYWPYGQGEAATRGYDFQGIAAWKAWAEKHQSAIVGMGGPLGKTKKVSQRGIEDTSNEITVLLISLILFFIAGWHLPHAFITGLQIS